MEKLLRREFIGGVLGTTAGLPVFGEALETVRSSPDSSLERPPSPFTITGAQLVLALKLWSDLRYIDGWVQVEGSLWDPGPPTVSVSIESAEWGRAEEFHRFFFPPKATVAVVARVLPARELPYLDAPFRHGSGYDCKTLDSEKIECLTEFLARHEASFCSALLDIGSVREQLAAHNPGLSSLLGAVASGEVTEVDLKEPAPAAAP